MTYSKYMDLHSAFYNYCAPNERRGFLELHRKLANYFSEHVQGLRKQLHLLQGEAVLTFYATEWDRYTTAARRIDRFLGYLNRYDVKVYPVYELALSRWSSKYFSSNPDTEQSVTEKLVNSVVHCQRNGELVDQGLIKTVCVYKDSMESPFLEATKKYYKQASEAFLAHHSVSDYLWEVEKWLKEEGDRADHCLPSETRIKLISACEDVLIRQCAGIMLDSLQGLLENKNDEGLQRMYTTLSRINLESLRKTFEEHVKKAGLDAIANLTSTDAQGADGPDPTKYVNALLQVHREKSDIVTRFFKGKIGFSTSLDKACVEFVNRNAATSSSIHKSPELLARHVDMLLREKKEVEEGVTIGEDALHGVMILFKYIEEKDIFQTFYTRKLSKRLIHRVSASDEAEASMIYKLKDGLRAEYSNKLERMLTDKRLSNDLTENFKEHMRQNHNNMDITFSIMVLGNNICPLSAPNDFVIPPEILPTYDSFTKYYQSKHSGRKLTWLWHYSRTELRTKYLESEYILMTSSYQMAVLLQYNKHDTLSLDELIAATAISREILTQVLGVLVEAKILINEKSNQYAFNPKPKLKKKRILLNQPIKVDTRVESSEVLRAVDGERKYVIQATIVRIMKARKTMQNQPLIQEVISQLSKRFTPKVPDIKKEISILLDKGYIKRVGGNKDTFAYVA